MAEKFRELQKYVGQLQGRVQTYANLKARLDVKGGEVRQEISKRIEEEGDLLRAREKQLLRQVDVVTAHFMSVYLTHHAQLHQLVGIAQSFLIRYADHSSMDTNDETFETEAADLVDKIRMGLKQCNLTTEEKINNPIAVHFPDSAVKELERIILDFGEVESGSSFLMPFKAGDADRKGLGFLPYGHEDYLDSEAEVLQSKPLLGSPSLIRFPKKMHPMPNHTSEDKSRWLLQHLDKQAAPAKQQNIESWFQIMNKDDNTKKSESSCGESIEILGNIEDDGMCHCKDGSCDAHNQTQWMEDGEFLMLKMFCKKDPVCKQIEECCGINSGECCVRKALDKDSPAVSVVNINNRSVSRAANWLLKKNNQPDESAGDKFAPTREDEAQFSQQLWEPDVAAASTWRTTITKHWEKIWSADNETWLIRRKRLEDAANEVHDIEQTEVEEVPKSIDDEIEKDQLPECAASQPSSFMEKLEEFKKTGPNAWRLFTSTASLEGDFFAQLNSLRECKAKKNQWTASSSPAVVSPGPINYKSWLAPACNTSPHQEKFWIHKPSSDIVLERNIFPKGPIALKPATNGCWLLKSK